ncbi:MAG: acyl-phosphate glycerol 3-phosphate acyltransferase [Deltaproteobacteria bacterium]|nr:MAG: acyl-phosphate glycerol 3-phosphate acyltransferase [Deltaproteobacteria bacterium]
MQILFPIVGYLIGAIPFGLVFGKMAGIDVRNSGSKNIGATNVNRLLGKKLGFLTLVCDCCKGIVPMLVAQYVLADSPSKELAVAATGVLAVIGHMFPIYLGFRGGKGVATGLGVFLYLCPLAVLIGLAIFIASVLLSGFVSVGSLLASALLPVSLVFLDASSTTIAASIIIALLIWTQHRANIVRLVQGKEKSWKKEQQGH